VPAADTRNIVIPRAALVERAGLPGVFVVSADSQARFRLVRPGKIHGDKIEILSGLHSGEALVVGDLGAVRDGSPVKIHETADKRR
jgi:multidrug efflux pump subunit AcrA (membrane-fusion protein)